MHGTRKPIYLIAKTRFAIIASNVRFRVGYKGNAVRPNWNTSIPVVPVGEEVLDYFLSLLVGLTNNLALSNRIKLMNKVGALLDV